MCIYLAREANSWHSADETSPTLVIHFINSLADAKNNIGELLAGNGPKTPSANHIGTHDYSKPPRAIIFGRAFTLEDVKELNSLYRGIASKPVAWIAGDPDVVPPAHPDAAYAAKGADDVKKALKRWTEAGANSEDIVLYWMPSKRRAYNHFPLMDSRRGVITASDWANTLKFCFSQNNMPNWEQIGYPFVNKA